LLAAALRTRAPAKSDGFEIMLGRQPFEPRSTIHETNRPAARLDVPQAI